MTMKYTMILKSQLVFLTMSKLFVNGEWIEMPQFSDESKVYKTSVQRYNSFQNNFSYNYHAEVNSEGNNFRNTDGNDSQRIRSHETEGPVNPLSMSTINPVQPAIFLDIPVNVVGAALGNRKEELRYIESSTPVFPFISELLTEEPSLSTTAVTTVAEASKSNRKEHGAQMAKDQEIQDYLPLKMLQKVHQTLNAQPATLEGKIRFLKQFEMELISEIETRLSTALAPVRRTRGSHDYHDHDDEIGFPSLEGALMTISFLTFAVYLVRLVMLLFRTPNNTTTTGATIFFGRRRRSIDMQINKTEEILNYLNIFDNN